MHDILEPLHHKIDYVEFASADPARMCDFFRATLGWSFEWFGEDYVAFHGASIVKPVFSFPGGRRFQFAEPTGNEFAVWSDS